MRTVSELQARVASDFALLSRPSWPNPHPDMSSPHDEEYSRLTDPGRYRIVHDRARIWAKVLEDDMGVRPEVMAPGSVAANSGVSFDRGVRLVPRRPEALPLFLLERDVPTEPTQPPLAVLDIALARPDIVLETYPDCGCDACDLGSVDLLEAVDAVIGQVVGGPFVLLRGPDWHAEWHTEGGSATGAHSMRKFDALMELCRALADGETASLPKRTYALIGQAWIS